MVVADTLSFSLWSTLLLFGVLQGAGIILAVLTRAGRRNRAGHVFFAAFLGIITYLLLISFLFESRLLHQVPWLLGTPAPLYFLLGPILYWHLQANLDPGFDLSPGKHWWHFLAFVICVLSMLAFFGLPISTKIQYIQEAYRSDGRLPSSRAVFFGLSLLHIGSYWMLARSMIRKFTSKHKQEVSNWAKESWTLFGLFLAVFFLTYLLYLLMDHHLYEIRYTAYLLISLLLHLYGYRLLIRSAPLGFEQPVEKIYSPGNGLSTAGIKIHLLRLMEDERVYRSPELKLAHLAHQLDVSVHFLSQMINSEFRCNYNDFVNRFRIEEAQSIMSTPASRRYSLEGIAFQVGFNNRTTFNRAFKKHTQMTPTQFLDQLDR